MLLRTATNSIRFLSNVRPNLVIKNKLTPNTISKRWSGHNAMEIEPSNFGWKHFKNLAHFYVLLGGIPTAVIVTIISVRANPELSEVPEGYEPRHWEYYKHPITRFISRYLLAPDELDDELFLALFDAESEIKVMQGVQRKVDDNIAFYNDHRSYRFLPYFAEYFRIGRDDAQYAHYHLRTQENRIYDSAYDPKSNFVPIEGFHPEDAEKIAK